MMGWGRDLLVENGGKRRGWWLWLALWSERDEAMGCGE